MHSVWAAVALCLAAGIGVALRPEPALAQSPAQPGSAAELTVVVGEVVVEGGFEELAPVTEELANFFRGRRSTAGELEALAFALEQLYQQAGYMLARVAIPPQEVTDGGTFHLLVIDGYIEAVHLDGVPSKARPYLERLFGRLVNRSRLTAAEFERVVLLARQAPGMTVRTTLVPGDGTGAAVLVVEAEHTAYSGSASFTSRLDVPNPAWAVAASVQLNQPFGRGEQISLHFSAPFSSLFPQPGVQGRRHSGGGTVTWPLNADGLQLQVGFAASETYTPSPIWLIPPTVTRFQRVSAQVSKPVELAQDSEHRVSLALERIDQVWEAPDFAAELTRDGQVVARLSTSLRRETPGGGSISLSWELSQGVSGLSRSRAEAEASGVPFSQPSVNLDFHKVLFTAQWRQPVSGGLLLTTAFRHQFAVAGPLPTTELFSASGTGGVGSAALDGADNGWTWRSEVERSFALLEGRLRVSLSAWLAAGASHNPGSGAMSGSFSGISVGGEMGAWRMTLDYSQGRVRGGTGPASYGEELQAGVEVLF